MTNIEIAKKYLSQKIDQLPEAFKREIKKTYDSECQITYELLFINFKGEFECCSLTVHDHHASDAGPLLIININNELWIKPFDPDIDPQTTPDYVGFNDTFNAWLTPFANDLDKWGMDSSEEIDRGVKIDRLKTMEKWKGLNQP